MIWHSSQDVRTVRANSCLYCGMRQTQSNTAMCKYACLPVEVAAHQVVNDRSMLAQQMTVVVLEGQLPKKSFLHGKLWRSFPTERKVVRVDHLSPLILPKLHFVKGAETDPTDWNPRWPTHQSPHIYKNMTIQLAAHVEYWLYSRRQGQRTLDICIWFCMCSTHQVDIHQVAVDAEWDTADQVHKLQQGIPSICTSTHLLLDNIGSHSTAVGCNTYKLCVVCCCQSTASF